MWNRTHFRRKETCKWTKFSSSCSRNSPYLGWGVYGTLARLAATRRSKEYGSGCFFGRHEKREDECLEGCRAELWYSWRKQILHSDGSDPAASLLGAHRTEFVVSPPNASLPSPELRESEKIHSCCKKPATKWFG